MCFSAGASFGASAVLTFIGAATVRKSNPPRETLFAAIPLLFGAQQLTEGFLWLSLTDPSFAYLQNSTTYIFLFFAQVLWPVWVPYSIYLVEKEEKRKKILKKLFVIGIFIAAYLSFCLATFHVEARIEGKHISYFQNYPQSQALFAGILYIISTIAPPFVSSNKKMWSLGTAILISYLITEILYSESLVSVWCFFASIISVSVFAIMSEIKEAQLKQEKSEH